MGFLIDYNSFLYLYFYTEYIVSCNGISITIATEGYFGYYSGLVKALADYVQKQPSAPLGRVQLIREGKDNITGKKRMKRLDLAKSAVRARVMQIQTIQELDYLFLDESLIS